MSKRNRNRDKTNAAIFQSFIDYVTRPEFTDFSLQVDPYLNQKRFIKLDTEQKEWQTKTEVKKIFHQKPYYQISPKVKAALLRYQDIDYFTITGLDTVDNDRVELPRIEPSEKPNGGLLSVIIAKLVIPLNNNINVLEIINSILPQYEGSGEYQGHEIDEVKEYFLPIEIYEIEKDFILYGLNSETLLPRLTGWRLCTQSQSLALPFSKETLQFFKEIFLEGASSIPYENLVQCCYSVSWQHAFLELYRCIERLYPICILEKLYQDLNLKEEVITLLEFEKKIEETLKWHHNEEMSLKIIFADLPRKSIEPLDEIKKLNPENCEMTTPKWFYLIRNNIVHFRPAHETIEFGDKDWDKLIKVTLEIINSGYTRYESVLINNK